MKKAEEILSYTGMWKHIDILAKTDILGIEGYAKYMNCTVEAVKYKISNAENYIAYKMNFDCINLNTDSIIDGLCRMHECEKAELITIINEYIADLYRSMSIENAPSADEFIDRVLTKHLDNIAAEAGRNTNCTSASFSSMLFKPVVKAWKTKWEYICDFRVKLYDIYNNLAETSDYCSKDEAVAFALHRTENAPDKYSRYVILAKTPFNNKHDVIYTINGGFSAKHICKSIADADAWKAVFYDYTDHKINTFVCSKYMDKNTLIRYTRDMGAMYYVLTYRGKSSENYIVQYFKSDLEFHNPDVVSAIEEMFQILKKS